MGRYELAKPARPSKAWVGFNQRVLPVAINAAGAVEGVLEQVAVLTRRAPGTAVFMGVAFGWAVGKGSRPFLKKRTKKLLRR